MDLHEGLAEQGIGSFNYLYDHGQWYRSGRYDGPWRAVRVRELPPRIRKYRIEQIRRFRDDEYNRRDDRRFDRRDDRRDEGRPDRWDGPGRHDERPLPPR
jgi:hypothetical protein